MRSTTLETVRSQVERRYGRLTWAALVGSPRVRAPGGSAGSPESPAGTSEGARGRAGGEPRALETGAPSDALACWLGRQAVARLAAEHPERFDGRRELRSFLLELDGRTAAKGPEDDEEFPLAVAVHPGLDGDLLVSVDGDGAACAFVEGLIAGAAECHDRPVGLELLKCRKHGDNRCVIRVILEVAAVEADFRFVPLSAEKSPGRRARVV